MDLHSSAYSSGTTFISNIYQYAITINTTSIYEKHPPHVFTNTFVRKNFTLDLEIRGKFVF